ncbi:MAG TPA: ferredoxin [Streptosporangiaceae bacterium]|nr:ferredoxin [Streptosporangiaceae bacterium]
MLDGPPARHSDERHRAPREVACDRCGAVVGVSKFSPQHTSVQWNPAAVAACAEFTARVAAGEQRALIRGCASLRDSIDRAVLAGRLDVIAP